MLYMYTVMNWRFFRVQPFCVLRRTWKARGDNFTEKGILIRSVAPDESSTTSVLHYLKNGTSVIQLMRRREMFYMPLFLVLRCLTEASDRELYLEILGGIGADDERTFVRRLVPSRFDFRN